MANLTFGTVTSAISNYCSNEAIANNTHVVNGGMTGGPIPVVDHEGALEDYGQCVYDFTHVSQQAQEKPQDPIGEVIAHIAGSQDSKPEQSGIGSVIGNIFGGHTDLPTSQPQQNPIDIYNAHCPSYNNPDYHGFDPCIVK